YVYSGADDSVVFGVAICAAVAQCAAVERDAGVVAPGFAVSEDAAEAAGVEAGVVVVGFVAVVLAVLPQLEAHAAVAVSQVVVEQAIDAGGGIVDVEAILVVPGHVARDIEAGGVDH